MDSATIFEIRLKNAKHLISEFLLVSGNNKTSFCEKIDVSKPRFAHLFGDKPTANIGDATAKKIELAFDKAAGWLSHRHILDLSTEMFTSSAPDLAVECCIALIREVESRGKSIHDLEDEMIAKLFTISLANAQAYMDIPDDAKKSAG